MRAADIVFLAFIFLAKITLATHIAQMQFASSEVARLPRLAPLSFARTRRGTHIQSAPAATAKHTLPNNVLKDKPFTFAIQQWSSRRACENLTEQEWKGLPGVAPEQQPPHCNGRLWMKPFLLPPLLSHFGCRHRRGDSDRFAWKKPFRFVRGGGDEEGRGEQGCREAVHSSSSRINSYFTVQTEQTVVEEGENTPIKL